jgi:hypothetical protein
VSVIMLVFILLFVLVVGFFLYRFGTLKNRNRTEIQLSGIQITLIGGIVAVDPTSSLSGFEYFLVLLGLIVGIIGFFKD